jgi:mono/diheme cytochrome c family protein
MKYGFLVAAILMTGCTRTETPVMQYMPHMSNTSILKSERGYDGNGNGASVMMPPEGTLPRGFKPYHFETPEEADRALKNPLPMTRANLERGKKVFGTYCMVCHGEKGYGDGPVVNPFPIPKSLQSDNARHWGDGHLFHVITKGQGVMPSYATQVRPIDRWAAILYVRALQRAEHPTDEDVRAFQNMTK